MTDETNRPFPETSQPAIGEDEIRDVLLMCPVSTESQSLGSLNIALERSPGHQQKEFESTTQSTRAEVCQARQTPDSPDLPNQPDLFRLDSGIGLADFGFGDRFDMSSDLGFMQLYLDQTGYFEPSDRPRIHSITESEDITLYDSPPYSLPPWSGFALEQMDPVEAKCDEVRHLLKGSEPLVTEEMISTYFTRENLLLFTGLYGKVWQRNYPILHAPTFELIETSPILLLAIMIVGANCCEGPIPMADIVKLAIRLLILIQNQPHEISMSIPPLPTIQASMLASSVLALSQSEIARKAVCTYLARNISMAERAGVFDPVDSVDYSALTEENFVWKRWIEQESRRRIACEIFCQDMASCIFQSSSPSFSPLNFEVELPCYESCWVAKTASQCLQLLRGRPQQIRVSTGLRALRVSSVEDVSFFEASGFGMFVLVKGLHCLLYQVTQYETGLFYNIVSSNSAGPIHTIDPEASEILTRLQQDLSGSKVASLADQAVSCRGSSTLQDVNNAFKAWYSTWNLRQYRELMHENRTFLNDPVPFWWLAKLYMILHCYASLIPPESEFAISRAVGADDSSKLHVQSKIFGWFLKFRRRGQEAEPLTVKYLSQVFNVSNGS